MTEVWYALQLYFYGLSPHGFTISALCTRKSADCLQSASDILLFRHTHSQCLRSVFSSAFLGTCGICHARSPCVCMQVVPQALSYLSNTPSFCLASLSRSKHTSSCSHHRFILSYHRKSLLPERTYAHVVEYALKRMMPAFVQLLKQFFVAVHNLSCKHL